jgi:PhoH-like ATPase
MPLPKEPSKPATTLNEIPPISVPKTRKPARSTESLEVPNSAAKTPLVLASNNAPTAKAPESNRTRNIPKAASSKAKISAQTPAGKPRRQVTLTGKKIFVLDTNVLMHDPMSLFRFEEHDVFLPLITLEELDNHKKGMSEVARHARQVSRSLDALMENIDDIEKGVALDRLGNVDALGRLLVQTTELAAELPKTLPVGKADNQILGVVFALSKLHPEREVALVSKDINMRIKARALGLLAEDYFNDQVLEDRDLLYSGIMELQSDFWEKNSKGIESWQQGGSTYYRVSGPAVKDMMVNQFVYCETGIPLIAQVLEVNGRTAVLKTLRDFSHNKNSVWGITARNREQNFALNLLMNPECDFVTLLGQAGTGKTLLALAAGLSQVLESKQYSEIIVTRATVPVGEDIGFLPGTEEEKMAPWMGAFEDNLEVLNKPDPSSGDWGRSATTDLIRTKIRIKSMNFMRGRTFINKFLIIDEAQNLSPKQMKTLITRAGPGTKVICLGNLAQIDTPYLTEGSSGLTYVVDRFKGWPHAGHITLQRGERSRLADFASDNL